LNMLRVDNLSIIRSRGESPTIHDLSFQLSNGMICLLSGDADLSELICLSLSGLILHSQPEIMISGRLEWNGKPIKQKQFNPEIAITLENPYSQLSGIKNTVVEEIAFGLEVRGIAREEIKHRIQAAAEVFDMGHLLSRNPATLSGGETQKVIIACSYVVWPELWILYRPLTELDVATRYKFLQELSHSAQERGTVIVMAEDPSDDVCSLATHTLEMDRFRITLSANMKDDEGIDDRKYVNMPPMMTFIKKEYGDHKLHIQRPVIRIKGLTFQYPKEESSVIRELDLTADPGECVWVVGPNGCGKTTLMKVIAGILKAKEGQVLVHNIEPAKVPLWNMARHVAYAFQNPDLQIFSRDVLTEVTFGPQSLGYPKHRCEALANRALHIFGLSGKEQHHPHSLNRSERKRLGLAATFAMDTPIIILDEPTQYQTPEWKPVIRQAIVEGLSEEKTFLIVTHDFDFIW
jgi:energy-coupling factor transport system ATP-binding protein